MPNDPPSTSGRFSNGMKRLFDAKHYGSRRLLSALDLPDAHEVLAVSAMKEPAVTRGQRVRALTAAMFLIPDQAVQVLAQILPDESDDQSVRAVAASLLGRSSLPQSEQILIDNLGSGDDHLRHDIARALACNGGQRALAALDGLAHADSDFLRDQARFAQALIAYRMGLDRDPLPPTQPPGEPPAGGGEVIEVSLRRIGADRIEHCLQSLEDCTYGLNIAANMGFWVTAGRAEWVLLLNSRVAEHGVVASLARRRDVAGLLARRTRETDTFATQYVILTRPLDQEGGVEIMVYRTDGELFYAGRAMVRGGEMTFSISNTERRGAAPTFVRGRMGPEGVSFDFTVARARRQEKRRTDALDPRFYR